MKFFTEQWYNDSVLSEMCFQLRKTQKASVFSEKFFEKLYNIEKKAFLKHMKRAAKFEKVAFDAEKTALEFDNNYEENLSYVKANIPEEILSKVADVRVLALGSATYDITDEITRFCGKINRRCESVKDTYRANLDEISEDVGYQNISSLDAMIGTPIESVKLDDKTFTIVTSPEYTATSVTAIFNNVNITEGDIQLSGAIIAEHELTRDENDKDKFVFGLLCVNSDGKTITFSLTASDFQISSL